MTLSDSVDGYVLITGADRNIGKEIAHHVARLGHPVILHARTTDAATGALADLRGAVPNVDARAVAFDLASAEHIEREWAILDREGAFVRALVNNAADQGMDTGVLLDLEQLQAVFAVNVFGPATVSRHAATRMIDRGIRGAIVNISSLAGSRGIAGRPAYSASKAALDGVTRGLALELAVYGITVNSIVAGYVHNDRWSSLAPEDLERRLKNIPVGQPTAPAEIAQLVATLIGGSLPSLTGSSLVIDGGLSIQQVPADCVR